MFNSKIGSCFLGRTLELSNGQVELAITIDVGPRIISLKKVGGDNIMFQDINDSVNKNVSEIYGEGAMWHIYGGHRIWISPEEEKTYYPDNTPVNYTMLPNGAVFTPKKWAIHNVQPKLYVEFTGANTISVKTELINLAETAQELCIWNLTVMRTGATLTVPLSQENTGYLANRNMVFWSYDDLKDDRFTIENDKLILTSNNTAKKPFKVGIYKRALEVIYKNGNTTFIKRVRGEDNAKYPDYCCNMETYTSNLIHEVETLSPLKLIQKGESLIHEEIWEVK